MKQVYSKLRVLDVSRILVGPYASMVLGDFGAEVIKIETFQGDETRFWGPPYLGSTNLSTYFLSINRNKKSICIDMKNKEGLKLLYDIAAISDIIIENFSTDVTKKLKIDYQEITKINPNIIYASINGYGHEGPWAKLPGFDFIVQATSGLMSITGHNQVTKIGIPICDILTALHVSNGIQAALYYRQQTGKGCKLETSLYEATLSSLINVGTNYLNAGVEMKMMGNMHPSIVPYGVYNAKDGQIMIGSAQNDQFQRLCEVIKLENLERYKTNSDRVKLREQLNKEINDKLSEWNINEIVDALNEKRVPVGKIRSISEGIQNEQVRELKLVQEIEKGKIEEMKLIRSPLSFVDINNNKELLDNIQRPPYLNEHRDYVLKDLLKYSEEKIKQLKLLKAII